MDLGRQDSDGHQMENMNMYQRMSTMRSEEKKRRRTKMTEEEAKKR